MQEAVHLGCDVGGAEGGAALGDGAGRGAGERLEALLVECCDTRLRAAAERADKGLGFVSDEAPGALAPARGELLEAQVLLLAPGRERRLLAKAQHGGARRLALMRGAPVGDEALGLGLDRRAAGRELGEQLVGDPGQLEARHGRAVSLAGLEGDAEAGGQEVLEHALVQFGERDDRGVSTVT